ncbi:MAG: FAD-binding oxidoreductase [Telmatospirillum sp.]|nr:FAD-binding oxidoreductase [Telmatospirillum sp.]
MPQTSPAVFAGLADQLSRHLPPARIITDPLRRHAWGTDASCFRLTPGLVVVVETEEEVRRLLSLCRQSGVAVTFRAAGTSLSGQAVSDQVLAVLGESWNTLEIVDAGARIHLGPGVIGADANRRLASFGRKIGPDPASIDACRIGGIAANNASGMCCGTAGNSYQTLDGMRVLLADGTVLDSGEDASRQAFRDSHGPLLAALSDLSVRVRGTPALADRIRRKFKIKNTIGYSLNALIDFEDPIDILTHLMIGSEGTLGFLSRVTYRTVEDPPYRASGLALFADMEGACRAVMDLKATPVAAVELLDRASLRSVADKPGMPAALKTLPGDATALLIEVRGADAAGLAANLANVGAVLAAHAPLFPPEMTTERADIDRQWAIRKGMFPTVGALRRTGTTIVTEDVAVPMEHLADAARDLRDVMTRHGYDDAIIFGHALAGNLHFLFTQDFGIPEEVERYRRVMDDIARVIAGRYDGALKAEHGTGRAMAPFVELEWGADAFALIREIKSLFDPDGLLNPGVILTDDPAAHVHHLKPSPAAFPAIDKCIECGMCEAQCPSFRLTLAPRQRIAGWREITLRAGRGENTGLWRRLFDDQGIDTCAACGLCSLVCPVGINTGDLTRALRAERLGPAARWAGAGAARHVALATRGVRVALGLAAGARRILGAETLADASRGLRRIAGSSIPVALEALPGPGRLSVTPSVEADGETVVYVPACASRTMGASDLSEDGRPLSEVVAGLCTRAGFRVRFPADAEGLCCGLTLSSKGMSRDADALLDRMESAVLAAVAAAAPSGGGGNPVVVMDVSPCSMRLRDRLTGRVTVSDLPEFLHDRILPRLSVTKQNRPVLLHIPCSVRRMGLAGKMLALAEACSTRVVVPDGVTCCGFAGDKGLFRPDLNDHALRHLETNAPAGYQGCSSSRTCEIGLEQKSRASFQSIAYLLDACTR